ALHVVPRSVETVTIVRPCLGSGPMAPNAVNTEPPAYTRPSEPKVTHGALQKYRSGSGSPTLTAGSLRIGIRFESRNVLPESNEMETWQSAVLVSLLPFVSTGSA